MEVIIKTPARKSPTFKECPICKDGTKLAGTHKHNPKHVALVNRKQAEEYGLFRIEIPEYEYYNSNEYGSSYETKKFQYFRQSKIKIPVPFGAIWDLRTGYTFQSYDNYYSSHKQWWVKGEDYIEIHMELINFAIDFQRNEEEERLPIYLKESDDFDAFNEKHHQDWSDNPVMPKLDYQDTLLDLQYAVVQFPHIKKTIIVVKEKDSNQYNVRCMRYETFDEEWSGIEETIFGWELIRIIEREGNVIRQGDLYLQPIVDGFKVEHPSEDAQYTWEQNGYESHIPEMLGVWNNQVVVKGKLEHPEHKDLMLKKWHKIVNKDYYD